MEIEKLYVSGELDQVESDEIEALIASSKEPYPDPIAWLDEEVKKSALVTSLENVLNWGRRYSVWPFLFFPACCAFELISTAMSRFDISRFGMELLRASPRQADLMLVAGTVTWKLAPALRRLYNQMPEPKWVVAMGACAISGGAFRGSYSVVPGVNLIVPVDVYIPGCPPRPEALLNGLIMLHRKIAKDTILGKDQDD
jgi:NADH-quinone oxidoreductase subunit B